MFITIKAYLGMFLGIILKRTCLPHVYFTKEFCWPSRANCIIGRDHKFEGYIHPYKSLPGAILGLTLKNKMAAMAFFSNVTDFKSAYIFPILGSRGMAYGANP